MSSASQPREWRAPFWDMSAPPGGEARCLAAHVCFICLAGEVAERTGGSYFFDGILGGTVGCITCAYMPMWALTRYRLRQRLGIRGNPLGDLIVAGCCPPCYLAQSLNELDIAAGRLPPSALGVFSTTAVEQAPAPRVVAISAPPPPLRAQGGGVRASDLAAAAEAARSGAAK